MAVVTLEFFIHRSQKCIAIKFDYNFEIKAYIKRFDGVFWSKTHRVFYIYYDAVRLRALRLYVLKKGLKLIDGCDEAVFPIAAGVVDFRFTLLDSDRVGVYDEFLEFLKGKRFSKRTIRSYGHFVLDFLRFTKDKSLDDLDDNDVRLYIEWAIKTFDYAISTHRQMVSALKHFAYFYPACAITIDAIYMPKKDKKLPVVLSLEEVLMLLQKTKNLKHRVIIAMLYGSGLRVGEIIDLKLSDFDFKRKQLFIKKAKGRKDRYTTIAESIFPLLKNYHNTYTPKIYFIENPKGGKYSAASIRSFLKKNIKAAGIEKAVTPHTLRHSYATHMLEQGTDIRYIQELLGHSRPETTMIYTHVTRKDLQQITSPLDIAVKQLYLRDNNNNKPSIS